MKRAELKSELELIRKRSTDGMLHPEDVVKAARKESHPLHSLFTWDNAKAAEQHRLMQARTIIRSVRISNPDDAFRSPSPAYVALRSDMPSGGYRRTEDVVDDEELRDALRDTALTELRGWIKRYKMLTELAGAVADAAGVELAEAITA